MSIATHVEGATENTHEVGVFNAADAFLKRIEGKGAEKLPEENEQELEEEREDEHTEEEVSEEHEETPSDEETEEEGSEDSEEDAEDDSEEEEQPKKAKKAADDDVIVKIKVGDKEHEVPVKDLKRLYGQEASLTRKSQEVATERKKVEEAGAKQSVALQTMLQRAQTRAQPYQQLDFLALAKDPNITAEELTVLRQEAQKAFEDVNFYSQELDTLYKGALEQRQSTMRQQAIEAHKVLNDPKNGIKGWNQGLYDDIRGYAITAGLPANFVNEIVDPSAIKLLHKAMLFDKGQKALSNTTKVVKTPKKIMKSSSSETVAKAKPNKDQQAREALRKLGSVDAATNVFLSRIIG